MFKGYVVKYVSNRVVKYVEIFLLYKVGCYKMILYNDYLFFFLICKLVGCCLLICNVVCILYYY